MTTTNLPISQEDRELAFNLLDMVPAPTSEQLAETLASIRQRAMTQADAAGYRRGVKEILCDAIDDLDVLDHANLGDDRGFRNRAMMLKESHKRRLSAILALNKDQTDES